MRFGNRHAVLTPNLCVPVFSLFLFSFPVPRGIQEHLLNDLEWCSSGNMWAAGVWAIGDGAAKLHSTSLGPGLPSWSHIKEEPCLSTCAGWSLFRFPQYWSSSSHLCCIHTDKLCEGEGMIRCDMEETRTRGRTDTSVLKCAIF